MRSLIVTSLVIFAQTGLAQSANTDALMFRSIFSTVIDPTAANANKVNHLIYAPVPELLSDSDRGFVRQGLNCSIASLAVNPVELIARKTLCAMQESYASADASTFFRQGQAAATQQVDLRALTQNLKQQDLLIVVVPGIFGEFIKGRAFEEVFEKKSTYGTQFKRLLETQTRAMVGDKENCARADVNIPVCDVQEQLSRLTLEEGSVGAKNVPMSDLLNVASIDDDNGNPTAKVLLFQMDGMTLESLGRQKDKAAIFTRRLEKYFQITHSVPKNIAFVGYSRGTAFALEMLAQAKRDNKSWLNNVKALVSMGGVVMGSALADDVINNKKNPAACQLELADLLLNILRDVPDLTKKPYEEPNRQVLLQNTMGWYRFLVANARFSSGKLSCEQVKDLKIERLNGEEIKAAVKAAVATLLQQRGSDPDFGRQMIMQQSVKFGLLDSSLRFDPISVVSFIGNVAVCLASQDAAACLGQYAPDSTRYNTDIRRFRRLVGAARQGVEELTTDSRLEWWRNNTVPVNGVRYYSVSGTMADGKSPLVNNRFGYNPGSPDDKGLLKNWSDLSNVKIGGDYAGVTLNDSQVAIYKTVFWPDMITSLNIRNAGVRSTPLAVVGTHHWGMALPIVAEVRASSGLLTRNPFPRAELLYSIALSVANDIQVDAERGE
jgi:hypothetical protein